MGVQRMIIDKTLVDAIDNSKVEILSPEDVHDLYSEKMNDCCTHFIQICYFNSLDTHLLEWDYCPKCGTQLRRKDDE